MKNLSSKQRKLVYLGGIVMLLLPIIALGMPASQESGSGGKLAQLREEYELGESTLGDVDPSGATVNLVLLGMRGVAASVLWLDADRQKATKDWAKLRATVNSIIKLQPHFKSVWRFQGWNLAYNVSAEWDALEDRFYWVKEGAKFLQDGTRKNKKYAELFWEVGRCVGPKIGSSDEYKYFRKFFVNDPDVEQYEGRADPVLNPEGKDNFYVAKDVFEDANDVELDHGQRLFMRPIFRAYPYKMLHEYGRALHKEGEFNDRSLYAWEQAFDEWTQKFGKEEFKARSGSITGVMMMESTYEDVQALAKRNELSEAEQLLITSHYQKILNYTGWRKKAQTEKEPRMVEAHRAIYEGKQLFKEGKTYPRGDEGELPSEARQRLEEGMVALEEMLERFPELRVEQEIVDEALLAAYFLRAIYQLNGQQMPTSFPLSSFVAEHPGNEANTIVQFRQEMR